MEVQWIGAAFLIGFLAKRLKQPPLLGFLATGFVLELLGLRPDASLRELADVGILLLLFTIGVKLDLRSLATRHVLGTALAHMAVIVALLGGLIALGAWASLGRFAELDLGGVAVLAFALSFSSTVFAVKVLEERDDASSFYGRVAIGILIVQDAAAVIFMAASKGEWPSPWALGLVLLIPMRPLIGRVLKMCGHGELLILAGLAAALGGAALFEWLGIKADFGALVAGVLCGGHERSKELAKSLLGLKEVFLVGFFLSIGLTGLPTLEMLGVALVLCLLLPLKGWLFFQLLIRMRVRARTSLLAALGLTCYSEFGLIVAAVATRKGWLPESWLVTLAIAVGISFLVASILDTHTFSLYERLRARLVRLERGERLPEERTVDAGHARVLVFGMGRVGARAYDTLAARVPEVVGFDIDARKVEQHREEGRTVHVASATDTEFWERLQVDRDAVQLVLLAMSSHEENRIAIGQLRHAGYRGVIGATARYDDEMDELRREGADTVFHALADAGPAFAAQALRRAGLDDEAHDDEARDDASAPA